MFFKKFLFKLWLCICGAITIALLCVFTAEVMGVNDITAYAVDVVLTPQQTAALIGSTIPVTYHNATVNLDFDLELHLLGVSNDIDLIHWNLGDGYFDANIPWSSVSGASSVFNEYNYAPALIYYCTFPANSDLVFSNSATSYNMRIDFSLDLQGLTNFRFPVYYTSTYNANYPSRSNYTLFTSQGVQSGEVVHASGNNRHSHGLFYFGPYKGTDDSEKAVTYFSLFPISRTSEDPFSVSGIQVGMNACDTIDSIYNDFTWASSGIIPSTDYCFFVMIGCPVVSDYQPPVTTAPVTTTLPRSTYDWGGGVHATTPAFTVDLSTIEEQQRVQIAIENDNRNYTAGVFDGVNIIISQLDAIYSAMVQRGEIAVDLLGAPVLPSDSQISGYIDQSLQSFTTAQLPDETLTGGIGFIGALVSWFTESFGWLWVLAALNLCLAVLSFAIFRSKGG